MKPLFKIEQEYAELAYSIIENGGEITPEIEEALKINRDELDKKAEGYGMIINQINAECQMIDAEIERLEQLKHSREKTIDSLKNRLSDALQKFGIEKVKSNFINISFRKSESVEITDENLIPAQFKKEKITYSPDKSAIKDALKKGELIFGAILVTKQNIQIK